MAGFLFGPADDPRFTDRFLRAPVDAGRWATFPAACPSFHAALGSGRNGPAPVPPTAILVWPGYASVPAWVWAAPRPVVALAHDPNLLWERYRHALPLADLVLTDAPSAERLRRAGVGHARAANLFGLDRHFLAELDAPEAERDIDIVFVGNVNPAVQAARGAWLGRVGVLADRHRVVIAAGVSGAPYRALLRRAKLAFNHAVRGECNLRALEAAASGAVLLQEADNAEVPDYLSPGAEYAPYGPADFERVVERLLSDAGERTAIAARARSRVRRYAFDALIEAAIGVGGPEWGGVQERAARRRASPPAVPMEGRVWQRASLAGPDADPGLGADLRVASDHAGLAALHGTDPVAAEAHLALVAAAGGNRVAAVGHASALASLGRRSDAAALLRRVLGRLPAGPVLTQAECRTVPYPVRFDHLRVGWERAGYDHPDDPPAENARKAALLRCRAAALLAELTGELAAYRAAAEACPEQPPARAALGAALARAGSLPEAVGHLEAAAGADPFDGRAAAALLAALAAAGRGEEAEAARRARRVLARAAPGLVAAPETTTEPAPGRRGRFVELSTGEFAARFGPVDPGLRPGGARPVDAAVLWALVGHLRPRRLAETGVTTGRPTTTDLAAALPPDAVIYSLGVDGCRPPPADETEPAGAQPPREPPTDSGNHFGTGHKVRLTPTDRRAVNWEAFSPLDLVVVTGGRDPAGVKADSMNAYRSLRTGGCLVWHLPPDDPGGEAELAVGEPAFPEPVHRVAGTRVAFLVKGEGVGGGAGPETPVVAVTWEGEFEPVHSLAAVNRNVCRELVVRGHPLAIRPSPPRAPVAARVSLPPELAACRDRRHARTADVVVRHRWPPDFAPPAGRSPFVLVQPWEYGRLPQAWVEPILAAVDEVWVPSRSVQRAYTASGVPEVRVAVVPNGVDADLFSPGLEPLPLPTDKRVRLLFVGGTIPRKGFDVLLAAYRQAFSRGDDVCLVVKDAGTTSFYRGQTAGESIERLVGDPRAPEVVYLPDDLPEADLARLYAACDALVHPYRGEGFGLPVLEAMACGKPVVVTAGGPTDEFVPPAACWRVPARVAYFPDERVGDLPTAGRPWWLEPDRAALAEILKEVARDAGGRARRGEAARRAALGWTWARAAAAVEDRVRALRTRTPVRLRRRPGPPAHRPTPAPMPETRSATPEDPGGALPDPVRPPARPRGRPRVSLTMIVRDEEENLPACLVSVRDLVDEAVVVDTGSTDRTREVAARFAVVAGEFPWVDHFAAARNAALDLATGDYAFWMDADDRLDEENRARLRGLFAGLPAGGNVAHSLKCLCVPDRPGAGATAVDHLRVFRRLPAHRWTYRVHEQILPALRATGADVRWSPVTVRHVGYVDPAVRTRKLDRDLRLLRLDEAERPDDPFIQFNLASVYAERGDYPAATRAAQRSLARSHPKDSIVRKLYALLGTCYAKTGEARRAWEACVEGRGHYPDDAELLFLAAALARQAGDVPGAEALYRRLVEGREADHFASVDAGLRPVKGRHNLALLLLDQGRTGEAEGAWRQAVEADPYFLPAQAGLGELYLRAGDAAGVAVQAAALRGLGPEGAAEAAVLDARWRLARRDFAGAAGVLGAAADEFPRSVAVRVTLSHLRMADGSPPEVVEAALRSVLELDPGHPQARHNLHVVLRNTARQVGGEPGEPPA